MAETLHNVPGSVAHQDVTVTFEPLYVVFVLVFALYPLFRDIDSHPNRLYWLFGVMAVLGLAYLLFAELWPFPADVDAANLASGALGGMPLVYLRLRAITTLNSGGRSRRAVSASRR